MAISDLLGPPQPLPGVAVLALPQYLVSSDLDRLVGEELAKALPGVTTLALNVHTKTGVNLVIATRNASGKLAAALWIGKSGWDQPLQEGWVGALSVRGSWGGP